MARKRLSPFRAVAAFAALGALSGCVNIGIGSEPPSSVLTLTPVETAANGSSVPGGQAVVVREPSAPAELIVTRVPVQVNSSEIAYLKDAQWVDRPTRLFANLVGETLTARHKTLVLARADREVKTLASLRGRLSKFGYDAPSGAVVVRYDGVLEKGDGEVVSRRFEARIPGVPAEAAPVAQALNAAANEVAIKVSDWVMSQ